MRVAAFGGTYSNPYALRALLDDAARRGCERLFCLGDLGGFGAEPEAIWPLLTDGGVACIAGNYDVAIGRGDDDCGCGYRDRRDNEFAQIAYDYTKARTSSGFAAWMRTLPTERRERIEGVELHLVHGSPLGLNDFFWESLPAEEVRARVAASGADVVLCTHSGLPWQRRVDGTLVVNVGVVGRPANDGRREVWYAVLDVEGGEVEAALVPLAYDWAAHAASMRSAGLPDAFTETIETGWWTSCLQILPPMERSRGRFQLYRSELGPGADSDGLQPPADDDPGRAVVGLFGTALFPRRLQIDDHLDEPTVLAIATEARRCGFVTVGVGPRGAQLVAATDGWYWGGRLAPLSTPLTEVKRLAVERMLTAAQAAGSLPPAYGCAVAAGP
ncbi:MAG: metallophosphatase family protein [Actinomycetota bacterium]|nr:metallophosphatase family protein [Actinomycetota bacterium]